MHGDINDDGDSSHEMRDITAVTSLSKGGSRWMQIVGSGGSRRQMRSWSDRTGSSRPAPTAARRTPPHELQPLPDECDLYCKSSKD